MDLEIISYCRITDKTLSLNGDIIPVVYSKEKKSSRLDAIYRMLGIEYPKFFKMDNLCKTGFLAAELICNYVEWNRDRCNCDAAIICFNSSSSLDDDTVYQKTICDKENYYPSPSVFVYTLANIVTGEIAIRNKIMVETAFYITENFSSLQNYNAITDIFHDDAINNLFCGWTEYYHNHCDVLMMYLKRNNQSLTKFTPRTITDIYDMNDGS
jgi:hypothetical protein